MAREFGKLLFGMFVDDDFTRQRQFDKLLYVALVGQPAFDHAGIAPVNFRRLAKALRDGPTEPTRDDLLAGFARLERARYTYLDIDTGEVLIRSFMRSDGVVTRPNVLISALKSCLHVESQKLATVLRSEVSRIELPLPAGESAQAKRIRAILPALRDQVLDSLPRRSDTSIDYTAEGPADPLPDPHADGLPEGHRDRLETQEEHLHSGTFAEGPADPLPEGPADGPVVVAVVVAPSTTRDGYEGEGDETGHESAADAAITTATSPHEAQRQQPTHLTTGPNHEPPTRCPRHLDDPHPPACAPCGRLREAHERWTARQARAVAERRSSEARQRAEARAAAIRSCALCDNTGYRHGRVCDHDPGSDDRTRRGIALVRAALTKPDAHRPDDPDREGG